MTWIVCNSPDGRGGFLHARSEKDPSLERWAQLELEEKSDYVAVFQGEQRALTVNDIELEKLPRTLVLQKSYKQIRDLCWAENAQFIITDPLRQIIEAHDPGQHIIWEQVIRTK
ncbi:MAG: hypothetical protein AAGK57_02180, partial [Pseudomonadota bacterium]